MSDLQLHYVANETFFAIKIKKTTKPYNEFHVWRSNGESKIHDGQHVADHNWRRIVITTIPFKLRDHEYDRLGTIGLRPDYSDALCKTGNYSLIQSS
jgi:hypothetical protein